MLIKRLMHRWVLMEEAAGGEGGSAGGGAAAPAAAPAGEAGNAGAGAAAAGSQGSSSSAAATPTGGESAAAGGEASQAASQQAPASLIGESKEGATEGAEAGEKKDGTEGAKKEGAEAAGEKPIEYTDFVLPEGTEVDAEQMKAFKEAAAGAKLSQEQAQSFVDMHQAALKRAAEGPYELWRDTQKQWQDEIKADPEFGGAKLETETIPAIARAIKAFSPNPEAEAALRKAFSFTGAGNNPDMIRFMARVGKAMSEGTHVSGKPTSGDGGRSAAQKLYPTQGGATAQT